MWLPLAHQFTGDFENLFGMVLWRELLWHGWRYRHCTARWWTIHYLHLAALWVGALPDSGDVFVVFEAKPTEVAMEARLVEPSRFEALVVFYHRDG